MQNKSECSKLAHATPYFVQNTPNPLVLFSSTSWLQNPLPLIFWCQSTHTTSTVHLLLFRLLPLILPWSLTTIANLSSTTTTVAPLLLSLSLLRHPHPPSSLSLVRLPLARLSPSSLCVCLSLSFFFFWCGYWWLVPCWWLLMHEDL